MKSAKVGAEPRIERTALEVLSSPLHPEWRGVGVVLTAYIGYRLTTRMGYTGGAGGCCLAVEGDLCCGRT
jgi:hypothetical protein